jgi:hypothetical protein
VEQWIKKTGKIEGTDCKSEEEKKKSGASSVVIQGGIFILIASVSTAMIMNI